MHKQLRPILTPMLGTALMIAVSACADKANGEDAQTATAAAPEAAAPAYAAALAGDHRSAENKARDTYRHPAETLEFFGLKDDMTVVEIAPGGGWYTEVLAPLLKDGGTLYAAHNDPEAGDRYAKRVAKFTEKLASSPTYSAVKLTVFSYDEPERMAPAESADMVLTFRNVHNFHMDGRAVDAFKAFYKALKPGGVLGVVDHRLPEDRADEAQKSSGYMKVSAVKTAASAAGFEFAGSSEVNANAKDTADHPHGVWTLPPRLRGGEETAEKYRAIGESDRMTLKFVKPAR